MRRTSANLVVLSRMWKTSIELLFYYFRCGHFHVLFQSKGRVRWLLRGVWTESVERVGEGRQIYAQEADGCCVRVTEEHSNRDARYTRKKYRFIFHSFYFLYRRCCLLAHTGNIGRQSGSVLSPEGMRRHSPGYWHTVRVQTCRGSWPSSCACQAEASGTMAPVQW